MRVTSDAQGLHISVPVSPITLSFTQAVLLLRDLMQAIESQWPGTFKKEKEHEPDGI